MSWHTQSTRPLTLADVGRFIVGFGLPGFVAGHVEVIHGDYVVIDTGSPAVHMSGYIVADVIARYTFLDVEDDK
jgi:hypothetical protein